MNNQTDGASGEWKRFWPLPVVAALGYSTAVLHTYGLGAFIEPIQQEFGWSRAQITIGVTIAGLTGAALSIPIGLVVDRLGPRIVGLVGVLLMTASFALLGTATGGFGNWLLLWSFLAFANVWLQGTVWTKAVGSRFERSRGLAFAMTLSGAPLTATILPLIATSLIAAYDWRMAFMGVGLLWAVVVLPIMLLFFKSGHEEVGRTEVSSEGNADLSGFTFAEALRSAAFYKLLLACGLFAFTVLGLIVHFVPILTDQGADRLAAASVASLVGIFSVIGRFGTGFLLDRLPSHLVGAVVFLFPVVSCGLLLGDGGNPTSQVIAAALFGLTLGAEVDVIAYLTSRQFGLKSYGAIFGAMMGALSVGVALGPLAAGLAYDLYGGYAQFLGATVVAMVVSSVALVTLQPRRA